MSIISYLAYKAIKYRVDSYGKESKSITSVKENKDWRDISPIDFKCPKNIPFHKEKTSCWCIR